MPPNYLNMESLKESHKARKVSYAVGFANMNYLFWRITPHRWCNNKVFNSIDNDRPDILWLLETKAILWNKVQMEIVQTKTQTLNTMKEEIQSIPPRLRK